MITLNIIWQDFLAILKILNIIVCGVGWICLIIIILPIFLNKLFPTWKPTQKLNNSINNKIFKKIIYDLSDNEIENLQSGVKNITQSIEEFITNNSSSLKLNQEELNQYTLLEEVINKIITNKDSINVLQTIGFNFREALGESLTIFVKNSILKNHDNDIDKIIKLCESINNLSAKNKTIFFNNLNKLLTNENNKIEQLIKLINNAK